MPQCKMSYCREPKDPKASKCYCTEHNKRYLENKRLYKERAASMQNCASGISPNCSGKVSNSRTDEGYTICGSCQTAVDILSERREREQRVLDSLSGASTLDELKAWIEENLIG